MLRDGSITYVDVFRPDVADKFPALLSRTASNKSSQSGRFEDLDPIKAASSGYAVVIQDVRGRHSSGGDFYAFVNEIDDGHDSVEWVANQSWSNGRVGMYGKFYSGASQWMAAKSKPKSLGCIAPGFTASNYQDGWIWRRGAFELESNLSWTLGELTTGNWENLSRRLFLGQDYLDRLVDYNKDTQNIYNNILLADIPEIRTLAPYYFDWLNHPEYDSYWQRISIEESHSSIDIPSFNYGGWFDSRIGGTIRNYTRMSELGGSEVARRGQRLLIGPWVNSGDPYLTPIASPSYGFKSSIGDVDLQGQILRYYDHWLKDQDNGVAEDKPVKLFVMGENEWRYEETWPLSRASEVNYYIHSDGRANTLNGDGKLTVDLPHGEPPDVYVYNPIDPVPSIAGDTCCDAAFLTSGAIDQRSIEVRHDVLVYTSSTLERDTEITGPVSMILYASTSAVDTDFTVKLVDVSHCGCAMKIADGIIRTRYQLVQDSANPTAAGDVCEYSIDLRATSNLFKRGHKIRIEVSSSNYPKYDRNTNTGSDIVSSQNVVSAMQAIYHSNEYPSHIKLPFVQRD